MTPHKCPKCNGTGWLYWNPAFGPLAGPTASAGPWHCNVCQGGIIWSQEPQPRAAPEKDDE